MKKNKLPATIKEAVDYIIPRLSAEEKEIIKKDSDSVHIHHIIGMRIRNELGLWDENKALLKECYAKHNKESNLMVEHSDSASSVIIGAVRKKLKKSKQQKLMSRQKPDHNKKILELLEQLWNKHPTMRLGQLLEGFIFTKDKMFYQENEKTIGGLKKALKKKFN